VRRSVLTALTTATVVAALLSGCGAGSSTGRSGSAGSSGSVPASTGPSGKITVLAAASLTGSFTTLGRRFEAAHPATTITFSFGASSTLATQIVQGAPADVFASASPKNMDQVTAAKAGGTPRTFARNVMEIAVPADNPAHITSLADLTRPGVKVALCAATVPCGAVARKVFANAKLAVTPVTTETDVKATLTKVELGEVDAGVVYVTDVLAAGSRVSGVPIPDSVNASTSYPIATLHASTNPALAKAFVDFVLSADGTATLTAAGFAEP